MDTEHLDVLVESSGKVASRIRDEVLEEVGTGSASSPDSAQAYVDWVSGPKHGRVIGTILKLVGEAGIDDSVKEWGSARGLEAESPATFHSRHITLPLPGAATDVVTGTLPGTTRRGSIAWITFSSDVDMERNYVAVVGDLSGAKLPVAWVEPGEAAVPGFGADIPPAALEDAEVGGLGISTAGEAAAVILEAQTDTPGARVAGAEIDALMPRAVKIFDALA